METIFSTLNVDLTLKPSFSYDGSPSTEYDLNAFSKTMKRKLISLLKTRGVEIVTKSAWLWHYTFVEYNAEENLYYTNLIFDKSTEKYFTLNIDDNPYRSEVHFYSRIVEEIMDIYGERGPDTWMLQGITIYEAPNNETSNKETSSTYEMTTIYDTRKALNGEKDLELFLTITSIKLNMAK